MYGEGGVKPVGPNSHFLPKICFWGFPNEILWWCWPEIDAIQVGGAIFYVLMKDGGAGVCVDLRQPLTQSY